ncbi:MAG: hypothetical protein KHF84_04800 [Thermoplasmata archaeon]|nr:hypothetical protein [Candidatus Sysuiplasma jiujiangense]
MNEELRDRIRQVVLQTVKESVRRERDKYKTPFSFYIFIDLRRESRFIAHSDGFILPDRSSLVGNVEFSLNRIARFPEELLSFIAAHEIGHCVTRKIHADQEIEMPWVSALCDALNAKSPDNVFFACKQDDTLLSYIKSVKMCFDARHENNCVHECIDAYARDLLCLSQDDVVGYLRKLKASSEGDSCDIERRIEAAIDGKYAGCKETLVG